MLGSYMQKNLDKPADPSAGGAKSTKTKIFLLPIEDVFKFPERELPGRVKLLGNIVPKEGKHFIYIYETPSSQKDSYETQGEEDGKGFRTKFEGTHPGNEIEAREFVQNNINGSFIALKGYCSKKGYEVYGTECSPMTLTGSYEGNSETNKTTLVFEQTRNSGFVMAHYEGTVPMQERTALATTTIEFAEMDNPIANVDKAVTGSLTVGTIALAHGTTITLVGNGGDTPATLDESLTGTLVLLADGTQWVAEENAAIHLKVFNTSSGVALVELSRS